jgi:hypothetical protein
MHFSSRFGNRPPPATPNPKEHIFSYSKLIEYNIIRRKKQYLGVFGIIVAANPDPPIFEFILLRILRHDAIIG